MKLFGTNGIRGDAEKFFTNDFCFKIAATFFFYLQNYLHLSGPIAVGYDPRYSSYRILKWLIYGLRSQRAVVYDEGITPSPCLTYFTKVSECSGGVMITGSHIREDMNGLKLYIKGEEVTKKQEAEIEELYDKMQSILKPHAHDGQIRLENRAVEIYKKMLVRLANVEPPAAGGTHLANQVKLGEISGTTSAVARQPAGRGGEIFKDYKVVVDAGNGTQSLVMPEVLRGLGIEVIETCCDLANPLLSRDTETQGAFAAMQQIVLQTKADFGVGYDSDGDRAAFVTNQGVMLTGDVSCSLVAKSEPSEYVVTPINTSSVVEHIGKKVERTKVGATYVAARMKEVGARYGFEANGGGISGEIIYGRDAGSTTIKILKILRQTKKDLQSLVDELPKFHQFRDKVDCPRELNEKILATAKAKYAGVSVNELDGLKFTFPTGDWLLFRPSGNAPEFRVFSESQDPERAKKLSEEGMALVKETISRSVGVQPLKSTSDAIGGVEPLS